MTIVEAYREHAQNGDYVIDSEEIAGDVVFMVIHVGNRWISSRWNVYTLDEDGDLYGHGQWNNEQDARAAFKDQKEWLEKLAEVRRQA